MKNAILLIALAIGLIATALAQPAVADGPAIQITNDTHDFGTIDYKSDGTCTFIVTNTGTEPLIITGCKKSCGCTSPVCPQEPIMPGKSTVIKVKYDTSRVGPFSKMVTVTSNAVNEPVKVIRIKGTVKPDDSAPTKTNIGPANGG